MCCIRPQCHGKSPAVLPQGTVTWLPSSLHAPQWGQCHPEGPYPIASRLAAVNTCCCICGAQVPPAACHLLSQELRVTSSSCNRHYSQDRHYGSAMPWSFKANCDIRAATQRATNAPCGLRRRIRKSQVPVAEAGAWSCILQALPTS